MNDEAPRYVHVDPSKQGDRTGIYVVGTWRCPLPCDTVAMHGEPCPNCGRGLLLD